jgi:hypothetical protein
MTWNTILYYPAKNQTWHVLNHLKTLHKKDPKKPIYLNLRANSTRFQAARTGGRSGSTWAIQMATAALGCRTADHPLLRLEHRAPEQANPRQPRAHPASTPFSLNTRRQANRNPKELRAKPSETSRFPSRLPPFARRFRRRRSVVSVESSLPRRAFRGFLGILLGQDRRRTRGEKSVDFSFYSPPPRALSSSLPFRFSGRGQRRLSPAVGVFLGCLGGQN